MLDVSLELEGKSPAHRPVRTEVTPEQIKYVNLKLTTKLNNVQIAKQLGVHFNTIGNWNKSDLVKREISEQIDVVRKDNAISMQQLMASLIRESVSVLDNEDVSPSLKIQLIGQLFSQAGRFAGLEPPKQIQKKVAVIKTFEQMIDAEVSDDED